MSDLDTFKIDDTETYQIEVKTPKKEFVFEEDFGFSFKPVVEELEKTEAEFKKKFANQQVRHESTLAEVQSKLDTLHALIMPLLVNLTKEPEKTYISWPNRADKMEAFILKIQELMDS